MKNPYNKYPFTKNHYAKMFLKQDILFGAIKAQCDLRFRADRLPEETLDRLLDKSRWPSFLHSQVDHHRYLFLKYAPKQLLEKRMER